jgi:DNA-binding NarL/FixJ family response regulator
MTVERSLAPGEFFRAARFSEYLAATNGDDRIEVRLERARSYLVLSKGLDALAELALVGETTADIAAIVGSLRCRAHTMLGEWDEVERWLGAEAPEGTTAIGRAEIAMARTFAEAHRGRGDEMHVAALQIGAEDADPWYRSMGLFFIAWSFLHKNEYGAAAEAFQKTVEFILSSPERMDVVLLARSTQVLSSLSRDMFSRERFEFVLSLEPRIPWTTDLRENHFAMRRNLAWSHALHGSERTAHRIMFELFEEAPPTPQWRPWIYADLAYLIAATGYDEITGPLIEQATSVALRTSWTSLGEERIGLLNLIELLADRDLAAAQALLDIYGHIQVKIGTNFAAAHGSRLQAIENHARGAVLTGQGQTEEAKRVLQQAFAAFSSFGFAWRAAAVSLRLHALTADRTWLQKAEALVAEFPDSAIAREIRRRARGSADPRLAALSPTQRRVFELICHGKSNKEIASALKISVNTARNHVAAVLVRFGVQSRAQLAAVAQESGLLT